MNNRQNSVGGGLKSEFWHHVHEVVISLPNLLHAWREFKRGKTRKLDVLEFEFNLETNLFQLHHDLQGGTYRPSRYQAFLICDPKPRRIHKASVRDRVVHQAIFRILYRYFDRRFIYDSYSCRFYKGTLGGVERWRQLARRVSNNNQKTAYVLQCDIKKFFDTIDHAILQMLLGAVVASEDTLKLLATIINSFSTSEGKGLPLGNVTSQLFANVYLNELDRFVKHQLSEPFYLRYCDDFLMAHTDLNHLQDLIKPISKFLATHLKLELHPGKIGIRKLNQGIDWLGYVALPTHRVLRTRTKKRILSKLTKQDLRQSALPSYLGMVSHCRNNKLKLHLSTTSTRVSWYTNSN